MPTQAAIRAAKAIFKRYAGLRPTSTRFVNDLAEIIDQATGLPEVVALFAVGPTPLPGFIDWVADRFVHVHGDSPNVDYVLSLRKRAEAAEAALAKIEGTGA